ncbi:hypothetical protein WJT86_07445 [Microvirga sp. W0021]|uniref:Uncharacterized protein n=1 Tax=Hohaiivirga grylli TaxID=3133970 RepID=A0ABV0BMW7_9HYPH
METKIKKYRVTIARLMIALQPKIMRVVSKVIGLPLIVSDVLIDIG